jgi:hypothetical protein
MKKSLTNNTNLCNPRVSTKNILPSKFPVLNQGIFEIKLIFQNRKIIFKKSKPATRTSLDENMSIYNNASK